MMHRNFDRRVEALVPVKNPELRAAVRDSILSVSLRDTVKCWELCRTVPTSGACRPSGRSR